MSYHWKNLFSDSKFSNYRDAFGAAYAVAEGFNQGFTNKFDFGLGGSQTMTETETERLKGDDIHSGINTVSYKFYLRPRARNVIPTKIYLEENYSLLCNGTQGKQGLHNICVFGNPPQFYNSLRPANPSAADYTIPALQLNPYQTNTGSNYLASKVQPSSEKISLANMSLQLQITNFSTASAYFDIYVCQAKQDIMSYNDGSFSNAVTTWGDATAEATYGTSGQTFAGATYAAGVTKGWSSYNQIGNRPTLYPGWNEQWRVLKIHKIALAANAEQFVNLVFTINQNFDLRKAIAQNPNQTDDSTTWTYANQRVSIYRGGVHVFAVSRGQGVVNTTDASVTTADQEIGCVVMRRTKYNLIRSFEEPTALVQGQSNISTTGVSIKQINITDVVSAVTKV